jgi:hypothetical protein
MNEDDLKRRLLQLEENLEKLTKLHQQQTVYIETLHMYQPTVEALSFNLDQLKIQDLSGSLNLGNNFGTMPATGKKSEEKKIKPLNKEHKDGNSGRWERTGPGVCYRWKE